MSLPALVHTDLDTTERELRAVPAQPSADDPAANVETIAIELKLQRVRRSRSADSACATRRDERVSKHRLRNGDVLRLGDRSYRFAEGPG